MIGHGLFCAYLAAVNFFLALTVQSRFTWLSWAAGCWCLLCAVAAFYMAFKSRTNDGRRRG
jgi:hypothetical protein